MAGESRENIEIGAQSRSRKDADRTADRVAKDKSYGLRSFVLAWKKQQEADRNMRGKYANRLILVLILQVVLIHLFFALIWFGTWGFKIEPWVAQTFIVTTYLEISSLILIVAKYLFPAPTDKALEVIGRLSNEPSSPKSKKANAKATNRESGQRKG